MDDAVGGPTRKQMTQIRYHVKAEHFSFPTIIKSKQSRWNTDQYKSVFVILEEWNCEHRNVFIFAHLICDPPIFTVPYLHSKIPDLMNRMRCPWKGKHIGFPMIWNLIYSIQHIFQLKRFPNFLWGVCVVKQEQPGYCQNVQKTAQDVPDLNLPCSVAESCVWEIIIRDFLEIIMGESAVFRN